MADLADGAFIPRVGTYLIENINDQNILNKPVIIKKPYAVIDKMKGIIAKNKDIEAKIDANHALSQLSDVEKTVNGIGLQEIIVYNHPVMTWIQTIDGNVGQF